MRGAAAAISAVATVGAVGAVLVAVGVGPVAVEAAGEQ